MFACQHSTTHICTRLRDRRKRLGLRLRGGRGGLKLPLAGLVLAPRGPKHRVVRRPSRCKRCHRVARPEPVLFTFQQLRALAAAAPRRFHHSGNPLRGRSALPRPRLPSSRHYPSPNFRVAPRLRSWLLRRRVPKPRQASPELHAVRRGGGLACHGRVSREAAQSIPGGGRRSLRRRRRPAQRGAGALRRCKRCCGAQ